jgi:hypothetical protein
VLRDYKTDHRNSPRYSASVASVVWRFLHHHEPDIAGAAGAARFDLVTSVPSSCPRRDATNPLRLILSTSCWHTLPRHRRALHPVGATDRTRAFDPALFAPSIRLNGEAVLLVDDLWVTGARAQSAAAALRKAGAGTVGLVVLGRHLTSTHPHVSGRLDRGSFGWNEPPHAVAARAA